MEDKKIKIPNLVYKRQIKVRLPKEGDVRLSVEIKVGDPYGHGYCQINSVNWVEKKSSSKPYSHYYYIRIMTDEEAKEYFPDIYPIIRLNGSTVNGVPIRFVDFIWYFEMFDYKSAQEQLRCTDDELLKLSAAGHEGDPDYLAYLIVKIGLADKWEREAKEAIELFNKIGRFNFVDPYGKDNKMNIKRMVGPKAEHYAKMEKDGCFTIKGIAARRKMITDQQCVGERERAIADYVSDCNKLNVELNIRLALLDFKILRDDYIYYEHKNQIEINWHKNRVTLDQFNKIVKNIDRSKLPPNVQFVFGDGKI